MTTVNLNDSIMFSFIAVGFIAFIKASTGGGYAILAMPLLAYKYGAIRAAAILGICVVIVDVCLMVINKEQLYLIKIKKILTISVGAIFGVITGTLFLEFIKTVYLNYTLMILAYLYVFQYYYSRKKSTSCADSSYLFANPIFDEVIGIVAGLYSGLLSFICQAGGPPITIYFLRQELSKNEYIIHCMLTFFIINIIKLPGYFALNQFDYLTLKTVGMLTPALLLGTMLGVTFNKYVSRSFLYGFSHLLLIIMTTFMLVDGL